MGPLASLLGGVIGGAAEPVAASLGAMKPLFEDAAAKHAGTPAPTSPARRATTTWSVPCTPRP